jgi:Kyakuja-Dileera-Zisupton transposase
MTALHAGSRLVPYRSNCLNALISFFQQPNEEHLVPMRMHAIDGCDSQKRDKTAGSCDERTFDSEYFLARDFVDSFKGEVKSHAAAWRAENDPSTVVELEDGFVIPEHNDRCGSNWKAVTSKELPPASKEAFEQTGVFACLCRHGITEFLVEFVQSAEMYGLPFATLLY